MTKEEAEKLFSDSLYFETKPFERLWISLDGKDYCPYCSREITETGKCDCSGWKEMTAKVKEIGQLQEEYSKKLLQVRNDAYSAAKQFFKDWYFCNIYKAEEASIKADLDTVNSL